AGGTGGDVDRALGMARAPGVRAGTSRTRLARDRASDVPRGGVAVLVAGGAPVAVRSADSAMGARRVVARGRRAELRAVGAVGFLGSPLLSEPWNRPRRTRCPNRRGTLDVGSDVARLSDPGRNADGAVALAVRGSSAASQRA